MVSVLFENPKFDANVETMCRTANFYGVDYFISQKPQRKFSNARSAGAIANKSPRILNLFDWKGRIIVTDSSFATEPQDFDFMETDLIVFGNENMGISAEAQNKASAFIGIKQRGTGCRCLNVAAACAAILAIIAAKKGRGR